MSTEKNKRKKWSPEEKLRIINLAYEVGMREAARREGTVGAIISQWTKRYEQEGEEGLKLKYHKRIPAKKKFSSREEQLEYEIMRLKIENERLKMGYTVKKTGQKKEFVSTNKKNLK